MNKKELAKQMPILLDTDGVLGNFVQHCLNIANKRLGTDIKYESVQTDTRKYNWWEQAEMEKEFASEGFCSSIPVIDGAQNFVNELRNMGFRVVFLTSPPEHNKTWPYERREWLKKHFDADRKDVIFAVDKRYVNGFIFLDDHPRNIFDWQEYQKRQSILVAQPWNAEIVEDCVFVDTYGYIEPTIKAKLNDQRMFHTEKKQSVVRTNDWDYILKIVDLIKNERSIVV